MVTDEQVRRLRKLSNTERNQEIAASKAGMDPTTARRYLGLERLPSELKRERPWRTREDPFSEVWDAVQRQVQESPRLEAKTLFEWLQRKQGRTKGIVVLFDSRGKQMTSEVFATWLGSRRDEGAQHIVFAIGPADGWSDASVAKAQLLLSLGPMTMAHTLARVVAAEQLYRAYTILTGHPYHSGH